MAEKVTEFPRSAMGQLRKREQKLRELVEDAEKVGNLANGLDADSSPLSVLVGMIARTHAQQMRALWLLHQEVAQLAEVVYGEEQA